ncbi:Sialate O-acetylesterase [Pedobacter heparinus DSM 2366]|uniref:Sialate O-acetylesterase n=2 Tax=Pedobacter heparinus TaxID=984 RepID=C6XUV3_PEDHD|nr:Sialate O-acetylesterase [Pedobacter heparinus DSM 2366]
MLFISLGFFFNPVYAQLRLPSFFSDHMILQRDTVTSIWGWARAGAEVVVIPDWTTDSLKVTTDGNAKWQLKLPVGKAGKPHRIKIISKKDTVILNDVIFGELWLCSGQSNMQWNALNDLKEMKDVLPGIRNSNIRFLNVSNIASAYPQDDLVNSWQLCDSTSASTFSAIGYFFAEEISKRLNVPVGIINASWGGTCAEVWTPGELVMNDELLLKASQLKKVAPRKPNLPGYAWNSMVHPLVGYTIAGVLWYQGEDNVASYDSYERLFAMMIKSWRKSWNDEFPFYFAQIAPYTYKNKELPKAAYLREQQTFTALHNERVKMVLTSDLVSDIKNIHPTRKREVAKRFANVALHENYKINLQNPYSALYKAAQVKGDKIEVSFFNMEGNTFDNKSGEIEGLFIAGEDQVFHQAKAKSMRARLLVYSDQVKKPVAVRYAFSETDETRLHTTNGLPVSLFRTDNWLQFTKKE